MLVLTVPHLPDRDLGANSRDGKLVQGERSRLVKEERFAFGMEALAILRGPTWPVFLFPVQLTWVLYVPALRGDWDGWVSALKPWQDALVDIGLFPGDSPVYIRGGSVEIRKDKARAPCAELYVDAVSK